VPRLVFLHGPPAVGKLTVARAIGERQPFKVLHNHITIDAVGEVLPFGTDAFWRVVGLLRRELVAAAAEERIDLVYIYVFAAGEERSVAETVAPCREIGGLIFFDQRVVNREVLPQRVLESDRRLHGKICERDSLEQILDQHATYAAIPDEASLTIDWPPQPLLTPRARSSPTWPSDSRSNTASQTQISRAVLRRLAIEIAVAFTALALAAIMLLRGATAALRPVSQGAETHDRSPGVARALNG
jgi:hypothetical protein